MSGNAGNRGRRPTILAMMGLVLLVALGAAALRAPTLRVAHLSHVVAVFAILTAAVAAMTDRRRVFWLGFAVFAGGVLIFDGVFSAGSAVSTIFWHFWLIIMVDSPMDFDRLFPGYPSENAHMVCDSLFAVAAGIVGGLIALGLRPRGGGPRDRSDSRTEEGLA